MFSPKQTTNVIAHILHGEPVLSHEDIAGRGLPKLVYADDIDLRSNIRLPAQRSTCLDR
jgi:hypothetical protein